MIALLLAAALAQVPPPATPPSAPSTLGPIGKQRLPASGCAAFLWNGTDRQLVAMAVAADGTLRLSLDGRTVDLARSAQEGEGALGFAARTTYAAGDVSARLDISVVPRENLTAGAQVPDGVLEVDRAGRDSVIVPVAGLVGCVS